MQIGEALNALENGHAIWRVEYAQRVCNALQVPFDETLVTRFFSENDYMGVHMKEGCEGEKGVSSLGLSIYVAQQLGVSKQATSFIGKGSQAREFARVVREKVEGK